MTTYHFPKFQAPLVESGKKRRTIRALDRKHAKPGDELRLLESRPSFRPLLTTLCAGAFRTSMTITKQGGIEDVSVEGEVIADLERFARMDGFPDLATMGLHFRKWNGLGRFNGLMITW